MIGNILKKVFGSRNSRLIKEYSSKIKKINDLEQLFENKSDDQLKSVTSDLKARYLKSNNMDELLVEAFAASKRSLKENSGA